MNLRFKHCCFTKAIATLTVLTLACLIASSGGQLAVTEPKTKSFRYSLTGEDWLVVSRHNDFQDPDSWHPSDTNAVSTYRPVVVKHGNVWEITFRSSLPEPDLP